MLQVKNFLNNNTDSLLSIKDHFNNTKLYYQAIYKGDSKKYILIIGVGNIGYRHYQSLISQNKYILYIVEPNIDIHERVEKSEYVFIFKTIEEVPKSEVIDITIIATQANIREYILKNLVKNLQILNIIFEKPLCQSLNQLRSINNIILNNKINAWINTALILHPLIQKIKSMNINKFNINVYGNWDMCCNIPHYLILWCYLNDCFNFEIINNLDSELYDSKRIGNKEVKGHIVFKNKYTELNVYSGKIQTLNVTEKIQIINNGKLLCYIDTNKEFYNMTHINNNFIYEEGEFLWPKVSEYISDICNDIIYNNSCNLIEISLFSKTEEKLLQLYETIFKSNIIRIS